MIGRFLPGVPGPEIEAIFDMAAGNEIATGKFDSPESSGPRRQRLRLLSPAGVGIAGTQRSAGPSAGRPAERGAAVWYRMVACDTK